MTPQQPQKPPVDAVFNAAKAIVSAVENLEPSIRFRALRIAEVLLHEPPRVPIMPLGQRPQHK